MSARHETLQDCLACGHEKMHVNVAKGVYHCKRCGSGGQVQKLGMTPRPGLPAFHIDESTSHTGLPEFGELTEFAQNYLIEGRGVGWWLLAALPIFSTDRGILFVFSDWDYWQIRQWPNYGDPRWRDPLDAAAHAKDGVTYTLDINSSGRVVLVEGVGDALKVATAGYNSAALLSSQLHDAQAEALSQTYTRATLMLDADVPVGKFAKALDLAIRHFDEVEMAFMSHGDPGGQSVGALKRLLE